MEPSRRTFLGATGAGVAATLFGSGLAAADDHDDENGNRNGGDRDGDLVEVVSVTDPVPENVAFDWNGDLYIGITGGSVRRLPADRTAETGLAVEDTHLVAEYPGGVVGVAVEDGVLYTAVNGETGGVYALDLRAEDADPEELATLVHPDEQGFVNDVYPFGSRLLVTESFGGVVYEVPLGSGDCEPSVWSDSRLLDTPSFGANGITAVRGDVFVNVTRVSDTVGRVVRIPVECDGSAGEAEVYVEGPELFGADGLTSRGSELYVALNAQNRIGVVVPERGEGLDDGNEGDDDYRVDTVFEGGPLSFPSEVVFDPTHPATAFVCNFSNPAPEHGGVLRGTLPGAGAKSRGDDDRDNDDNDDNDRDDR